MQRLLKHAYLYATFSEEDPQLGAILVQDDVIVGAGWNQRISDHPVSEVEVALLTCQHSSQGAVLVTPMPPCSRLSSLIVVAEITHVVYHKAMMDRLEKGEISAIECGLNLLKEHDIEITEIDAHLGCFTLKYNGKDFIP